MSTPSLLTSSREFNKSLVQAAIKGLQHKVKLCSHRSPEPNGWVMFSGWTEATGQITVSLNPARPVKSVIYSCSREFLLDPIEELMADQDEQQRFGLMVVDGHGAVLGLLQGRSRRILQEISVDLPTKTRRGGQSQNRYARLNDQKVHRYLRQVAEAAVEHYTTKNGVPNVKGLILAGSADMKNRLMSHVAFDKRVADIVVKPSLDLAYGGRRGFAHAIEKSLEVIGSRRLKEEIRVVNSFMGEVERATSMFCFSANDTIAALEMGAVKTLIVSESLDIWRYESEDGAVTYASEDRGVDGGKQAASAGPLLEWIFDNYQSFGCELEIVTDLTGPGAQFRQGFGGIGGLLRWGIDFAEVFGPRYREEEEEDEYGFSEDGAATGAGLFGSEDEDELFM